MSWEKKIYMWSKDRHSLAPLQILIECELLSFRVLQRPNES